MPFVVKDRVKVTSTTTGTGTFTLGAAAAGFQDFSVVSPTTWNIAAAAYAQGFSVTAQETTPTGVFFKPDGTKMYVIGSAGDDVNEYNLSVPWDITTSTYLQVFSVAVQDTSPQGVFFKPDGTKMYVLGGAGQDVNEYDLSSAWNVSTASYLQNFSVSGQDGVPTGFYFSPDGLKMYMIGTSGDAVYQYNLSSAWNISTASYLQSFSVSARETLPTGVFFKSDGTKMYVVGTISDCVDEYNLSSAWDISTASFFQNFSVAAQDSAPQDLYLSSDGVLMYIVGSTTDTIYRYNLAANQTYYTITDGTDWEVGVGTCFGGTTLSRDTILESSNSNNAVNWGAGDKDVFCTYPADATEGTVPTADNSSVGTDLVAWTNLKKELDAGVLNGVPYANGNVSGMVSTYSLVYTVLALKYYGGVLAPNGDIHFVPRLTNSGQKISAAGVVSTYSLVYTNTTDSAYSGGVLAANGDIHFIPADNTPVGQKISASGVVSTYSLAYTTTDAYRGGVLAPNGDIHFVPKSSPRGQKISAAGVVSTYSLVYTASNAYNGGVLAPNGDIHFVPNSAAVGQKISAAGVVSTYSLVYTASNAYAGGVVSSNGDIHFVPQSANRGQKISTAGVVSTYSLVYTTATAYAGGVLAPNGDIHFVPRVAVVGQKISSTGVVSTYSLLYTLNDAFAGGVLTNTGEIYFIPSQAAVGQKISTNTPKNIGYCLSPFFNKF